MGAHAIGTSLRDRINRIAYVVVNVADLERSRAFYEAVTPLKTVLRTRAPLQRFTGLRIEQGQFDGYILDDGSGHPVTGPPTQVHLVQWRTPQPVGQPYPMFWHVGLVKLAFRTPSAKAKLAQLRELGIHTTNRLIYRGYISIQDPDGVVLSFAGSHSADLPEGEADPRRYERLVHTNPSVRDVDRALDFYGNVIGLNVVGEYLPGEPMRVSQGPGSDVAQWVGYPHIARGGGFFLEVNHFAYPPRRGADLVPYTQATHLGVARVGFEVDDIDVSYEILQRAADAGLCPRPAGPPEEWDYGAERGTGRVLVFQDPDGIRLELTERRPFVPTRQQVRPENPPPLPGVWPHTRQIERRGAGPHRLESD